MLCRAGRGSTQGQGGIFHDNTICTNTPSVFVNGRPRPAIMENMRARIDRGDIKAERQEAIQAMCDIAADRASKLQT
jgi:hypothetical protein